MIQIAPKGMTTGATAVVDDAGEKSPTSTFMQITPEKDNRTDELQFTDSEERVKLKFHPYRKPRNDRLPEELRFNDSKESVKLNFHPYRKPRSEIKFGSGSPETVAAIPSTVISSRRTIPAEKLPPAEELEEFFASAEKELHKSFKDKYNYDIVNDTPLEGRFEWIQLKR